VSSISPAEIIARIERLPISRWHNELRFLFGGCTFFTAYDIVVIAFVMPTFVELWHLTPQDIGALLAVGFAGQFVGAGIFGWAGERFGRLGTLKAAVITLSVFGVACGFARSYDALLVFRFLQGVGLGGEVPIAAIYINELAKAHRRGRFVLLYVNIVAFAFFAASYGSIWIIPHLGWPWMFYLGAFPIVLLVFIARDVPESPRWLARRNHLDQADAAMSAIERRVYGANVPPVSTAGLAVYVPDEPAKFADLFGGIYRGRTFTVWCLWAIALFTTYGLISWMPSIFRTVYHLSVEKSLRYAAVANAATCAQAFVTPFLIDRLGRRTMAVVGFSLSAAALLAVSAIAGASAELVMVMAALGSMGAGMVDQLLWVYTPEIYPTRMRSMGAAYASAWGRLASLFTPLLIGAILAVTHSAVTIFYLFAGASIAGACIVLLFAIEPAGRLLEEVSP
jgi:putative MFS transporter